MTAIEKAYHIGYEEAAKHDSLTVPAHSESLLLLIKETSKGIGGSIPLLEAFNKGQADWFHDEAIKLCATF